MSKRLLLAAFAGCMLFGATGSASAADKLPVVYGEGSDSLNYTYDNESGKLKAVEEGQANEKDVVLTVKYNKSDVDGEQQEPEKEPRTNGTWVGVKSEESEAGSTVGSSGGTENTVAHGALVLKDYNHPETKLEGIFANNHYITKTADTIQGGAVSIEGKSSHIGDIIADFIDNSITEDKKGQNPANGGAVYNEGTVGNVSGDFIQNSATTKTSDGSAYGGAIYNTGTIGDITGDFILNSVSGSTCGSAYGGAIYNAGTIGDITGDFILNKAITTGKGHSWGGAIFNDSKGRIGNITGKFISNTSSVSNATDTNQSVQGGAIHNEGTIGNLIGTVFENNRAAGVSYASGGAISVTNGGKIGDLVDVVFKNNSASTTPEDKEYTIQNTDGGAIIVLDGTAGNIKGVFEGNSATGKKYIAAGGAIYVYENSGKKASIGDIEGTFTNNYAQSDEGGTNGGAINLGGTATIKSIKNSTFTGNYAKSTKALAVGGAISAVSTITEGIINSTFTGNYVETTEGYAEGGAIRSQSHLTIKALNGDTTFKDNYVKGKIAAKGGAVMAITDLTIEADNGNVLFSGNWVQKNGGEKDYEAVYMYKNTNTNSNDTDKTLTLNATNNGTIQFDDKINGVADYNLIIKGDDTSKIILNNNVTNANAALEGVNLHLGVTNAEKHQSDVFKNSTLDVKSGVVDVADSNYTNYDFKKLTSSDTARYVIDMELSKNNQLADTFTVGEGSEGKIYLQRINVVLGDDEHPELVPDDEKEYILQIIKAKDKTNAPQLDYDNSKVMNEAHAHMKSDEILAKDFGLWTTDTYHDSIKLRGWKDNLAAWAEFAVDPDDEDQTKTFTFVDSSEHTLTRDIEELRGKDLTLKGAGNNLNLQGHNLLEHIEKDQSVTISDLNIKNGTEIENEGTLTLDTVGLEETSDITNNNELNLKGKMDILPDIKGNGEGKLNIQNGQIGIYGAVDNQDITHENSTTTLYNVEGFTNNNLTMQSGEFIIPELGLHNLHLGELQLNGGDINIKNVDVDLANKTMGRITADKYGENPQGTITVEGMNLLSDSEELVTPVEFADTPMKDNVRSFLDNVPKDRKYNIYSPLYVYDVEYSADGTYGDNGYFVFSRTSGGGKPHFNPSVLSNTVLTQASGESAVNETFRYVFEHADAFTQLPEATRMAQINADKYALSTDFNNNLGSLCYEHSDDENKAGWVRPYTTFESIDLKNGPKVDAITYGTLIGYDTNFRHLKHGWTNVGTGYLGYTGSQLSYTGVDTSMNGGLLGLTETFYKGNFWTALTASVGAGVANTSTMYGHEDAAMIMGGVASKSGYNFEFKEGKYIIQPIWQMSYTFVNTFDYTNAAGVRIDSDPTHSIQLNPKMRFIMNTKNGWQPYASVGMVWNLMTHSKAVANGVVLPNMSVKPYVEYGVGLQRSWNDKFTAFGQVMMRNGGRTGVALTAGFRWALGRDGEQLHHHDKVQKEDTEKLTTLQTRQETVKPDKKIIKQLSYEQKSAIILQNTTLTTYKAALKRL